MAESEDSDRVVDYYAILNVRKEANENEIKAAYRRMCMLYHPDKHRDPEKKKIAEELFSKIQKAYEVLSCPEKRGIYDIYGQKGLDAGWEGSIVVNVDATDLFDRYEDTDFDGSFFPNIEVKSMSISQSIEAPLTSADTLTLAGSVNIKNGNGSGSVSVSARRHSDQTSVFLPVLARQLDRHTVGYITYQGGLQTAMSTTVIRETENSRAVFRVQLSLLDSFLLGSYTRKIEKNTKLRGTIKTGILGSMVLYGCERQISEHSNLAATVRVGIPDGVSLKLKLTRANQVYSFPIALSEEIHPAAIFYGTVVPVFVFWVVKVLIVNPFLKIEKERESEAKREKVAKQMAENKKEAENSIRLMQETCERIVEYESSRLGLVIVNACAQEIHRVPSKVIDVTVPVQCQVKDSRLFLTESSKSNLSGFYDPCPEEEKMLRIRYLFREAIHERIYKLAE
ncbi:DnaJ-like protein subfamily C member 11 [Acropora cervicornis]|uniref:DnaJ-like protein subfamily C member 11 n=1 Tax=Acropora cervicornis TaxID=6130 RepID=A0AAD9PY42_ACRCE|nr:DnaJ-like protein subfamily C member 11 [Acropora cervicornis]